MNREILCGPNFLENYREMFEALLHRISSISFMKKFFTESLILNSFLGISVNQII